MIRVCPRIAIWVTASVILILLLLPSCSVPDERPGAGKKVRPARATWSSGYFQEAIYSLALEKLGYEVADHKEMDNSVFYRAVGQGEVDFWANGWFPLHNQYLPLFESGAKRVGFVADGAALQGYLVDKAGAEEYNLRTLNDFKREDVKEAYDSDGDGRADLYACPEGWGCHSVIGLHLATFDLLEHINPVTDDYEESMAQTIARYNQGQHIAFYTWTPNWTVHELRPGKDVVWIQTPSAVHPENLTEQELSVRGVSGCVADPCLLGFPANEITVVANNEFLAENPAAARLFEVVSIPVADIFEQNALMNNGENSQDDIERHAEDWVKQNPELFDSWISQARTPR